MNNLITETDGVKLDKCVICGCDTPYTENTHIDYRHFYVEGCGQLCSDCYEKIYEEKSNKDNLLFG